MARKKLTGVTSVSAKNRSTLNDKRHKNVLKLSLRLLALSSVFLSLSCESPPKPIPTTEAACLAIDPLPYHFANDDPACSDGKEASDPRNSCDTPETVRIIKAFNAGLEGLCFKRRT